MTIKLSPGGPASPADRGRAAAKQRLLRDDLARVREASLAWRNGLGALLAGVVGFGLVRGRSDIGALMSPWDALVGVLLLAALTFGAVGALHLFSAAHGRPSVAIFSRDTDRLSEHGEAIRAARRLRSGIVLTFLCTSFLVAAVGVTWYGPQQQEPDVRLETPTGTVCGTVVQARPGSVTLMTGGGAVTVDLAQVTGLQAAARCD